MPNFSWTPDQLAALCRQIEEYHHAAFTHAFRDLRTRKKAMTQAARACAYIEVESTLAGAVDFITKHPEHVRAAISNAYGQVDALRHTKNARHAL